MGGLTIRKKSLPCVANSSAVYRGAKKGDKASMRRATWESMMKVWGEFRGGVQRVISVRLACTISYGRSLWGHQSLRG